MNACWCSRVEFSKEQRFPERIRRLSLLDYYILQLNYLPVATQQILLRAFNYKKILLDSSVCLWMIHVQPIGMLLHWEQRKSTSLQSFKLCYGHRVNSFYLFASFQLVKPFKLIDVLLNHANHIVFLWYKVKWQENLGIMSLLRTFLPGS